MGIDITGDVRRIVVETQNAISTQGILAANELRNSAMDVLSRSPSPSSPGNPPGVRSNRLRASWRPTSNAIGSGVVEAAIETNVHYAGYVQDGTSKMAARPYEEPILDDAEPRIIALFDDL